MKTTCSQVVTFFIVVLCCGGLSGCGGGEEQPVPVIPQEVTGERTGSNLASADEVNTDFEPGATFKVEPAARTVTLSGFTRARTIMTLVSEESGKCSQIVAEIGESLDDNGVFARLDTTFIELDILTNKAEQSRLSSDVGFYSKEVKRYKTLVKGENAAQSILDGHVRNLSGSSNQLRAARVAGDRLQERLDRHVIRGPSKWKVISRSVEEGEWINQGQAVARIGQYDVLLIPFALTHVEYESLKKLSEITVDLPDLQQTATARIARVSPGFDQETRKISVDLEIIEGDFDFRGGIRVRLTLDLPDAGGAVLVPKSSLLKAYEDYFLVRPDGVRIKVQVLGSARDGRLRVESDEIAPGDEFLMDAQGY